MSACSSDETNSYYTPSSLPPKFPLPPDSPTMSIRLVQNSNHKSTSPPPTLSFGARKSPGTLGGPAPTLDIKKLDYEVELPFSESFSDILSLRELAIDNIYEEPLLCRRPAPSNKAQVTLYVETKEQLDSKGASIDWDDEDVDEVMLLSPMESHSSKLISVSSRSSLASAPGSLPQQACTYEHYEQASPSTNLLNIPTSFAAFQPLFSPPGPANTTSLCTHIPTGVVYACRFVRSINGKPSAERIALERIAAQIRRDESPEEGISFLQRLRWIMDNEDGCVPGDGVCIILDHYPNGSLQNYVYHVGMLDASLVQFYAAEIALGLNTLHELGITHGGLSPECVMIDKEGHAVICDFTRAQVDNIHFDYVSPHTDICDCGVTCSCGCRLREGSQCSYLAPEVLLDWKHDSAADSWGFGMVLYFMLFGRNPFEGTECELSSLTFRDSQLLTPLSTDDIKLVHPATRDLIIKCLHRNPSLRPTVQLIMRHAYFSRVDWGKVRRKLLQVPHFKRIGLKIACKPRSSSAASPSSKPRSLNSLLLDGHQRPRLELKRSRPMLTVDTDVRKSKDHIPKPAEGGEEWGTNTEHVRNAGEKMDVNTPPASTLDVRPTTPEIVARYIVAQSQGQPVPEIFSPSTSHVQSHDEEPLTIEDEELGETPKQDSDIVHYIDGRLDEVRPRTRVCENEEMDDDKVAQGAGILDNNNSENSLEHRSTLPCTPEARERIPHERFWEMLDEEEAVNSSRTTSSHLHFSPTRRRPRKLQKPRSSAVFTLQQPQFLKPPASDDLSQGNSIGLRRCKSTSALHPEYSEPVSGLPDGIEQVGMGIGYTQPGSHTSKSLALGCTTMNCYSVIRGSLQKIGVRLGGAQSASGYDETKEYQLHENKPPTEQLQLRHSMIQNTSTEGVVNACSGASDSRGAAIGFAKFL